MPNYTHVIWDWNGTLLNDLDWCRSCVNHMLSARGLPILPTRAAYHQVFCFPVQDYYQKVGFNFDKEPFADLAQEYMQLYHGGDAQHCGLHAGAIDTLEALQKAGLTQALLSASHQQNLLAQAARFPIAPYFSVMLGVQDIYASSKQALIQKYVQDTKPQKAVLIGDTTHDWEVARAAGVDCLLIARGHQSVDALAACGVPVLADISEVPKAIL